MSLLIDTLRARLADQVTLEELSGVLEQSREELSKHENESLGFVAGAPDEMVDFERRSTQAAYGAYRELLAEGQKVIHDNQALASLVSRLEAASQELGLALARLREIGWSARGPGTHPGANELLSLLEGLARGHALEESFEAALERELERVEHQWERLAELPEFLREPQEESLRLYQEWLRGVLEAPDEDPREWDDMIEELEQWATDYSSFDIDYLLRRYSAVPTAIPSVNFALNCQRLDLEELVPEDMVDYAVSCAEKALREGEERFLAGADTLTEPERLRYQELTSAICASLKDLPNARDASALKALGKGIGDKVNELVTLHRRAEGGQVGSRLDYKDPP